MAWPFAVAALIVSGPMTAAGATEPAPDPFALFHAALSAEQRGEIPVAIDGFVRACAQGLAPSCTMAGLAKRERAVDTAALMDAAHDLAAGCLAGSDFACAAMGRTLGTVSTRPKSTEGFAAIALLQMGEECRAAPKGSACHDAAALMRAEERGGADIAAVQRYAARACAREARPGCLPVAMPSADEWDSAERAAVHCLAARADGCLLLLEILLKDQDQRQIHGAASALREACAAQIGIACANLGLFHANGPPAARDDAAARRFMRAGCDGAVAQACFAFAVMHRKGIGGPVDPARSVALVGHACDLGWAKACETLATIIEDGLAPPRADQSPGWLRERACRFGSDEACRAGAPTSPPPV